MSGADAVSADACLIFKASKYSTARFKTDSPPSRKACSINSSRISRLSLFAVDIDDLLDQVQQLIADLHREGDDRPDELDEFDDLPYFDLLDPGLPPKLVQHHDDAVQGPVSSGQECLLGGLVFLVHLVLLRGLSSPQGPQIVE